MFLNISCISSIIKQGNVMYKTFCLIVLYCCSHFVMASDVMFWEGEVNNISEYDDVHMLLDFYSSSECGLGLCTKNLNNCNLLLINKNSMVINVLNESMLLNENIGIAFVSEADVCEVIGVTK